jgi:hypothetical protein
LLSPFVLHVLTKLLITYWLTGEME